MKLFFLKSLYLILPFLLIFGYVEYKLSAYPNSYTEKKEGIAKQLADTEILIFGTSHALNGINPYFFTQKTYNLANASQSLYYDNALLNRYIDKLPKLKTVIINISYFSFWYQLDDTTEDWRKYFYYQYFNITNKNINPLESKAWSKMMLYSPKKTLEIYHNNFAIPKEKYSYRGWVGLDTTTNLLDSVDVASRINFHHHVMKKSNISQNINYLQNMITKLQQKNINVILLHIPVYKTYSQAMQATYLKTNDSILENIAEKYQVHYYDYAKKHTYKRLDFHNHDHLSFLGAEKFSLLLDSILMNMNDRNK